MKKSTIFLILACLFALFLIIDIIGVFQWSDFSWKTNQGAYLTMLSHAVLFVSQFYLYKDFKKKEQNAK
ncbi:hypothetical protein EAX61_04545 [Dokdonia sinensis]|uniref:Uncharacterized protein n=1 Tax=Dokdonia sinensis TaxID=2479847 RepID=A0A3M0GDA4_9FLAO|nr:hypothetical protein [Dokdonia sinensis]RMB62855.1 hypothetical protein EAX61_04545 [Dokdonia sinensis]